MLNMKPDWNEGILIAFGLVMGLILGLVFFSPSSAEPAHQPRTQDAYCQSNPSSSCDKPEPETFWVRTFSDPLALFTFVLAAFTVILAIASIAQGYFTFQSTQIAKHALVDIERAFVYVSRFVPAPLHDAAGVVVGWVCVVLWDNSGSTPTKSLRTHVSWAVRTDDLPDNFDFPDLGGTPGTQSLIGPRAQINTEAFRMSAEQALALLTGPQRLFIWGWAEYSDVFPDTPVHRTEFCHEVIVDGNPANLGTLVVSFRIWRTHNNAT